MFKKLAAAILNLKADSLELHLTCPCGCGRWLRFHRDKEFFYFSALHNSAAATCIKRSTCELALKGPIEHYFCLCNISLYD